MAAIENSLDITNCSPCIEYKGSSGSKIKFSGSGISLGPNTDHEIKFQRLDVGTATSSFFLVDGLGFGILLSGDYVSLYTSSTHGYRLGRCADSKVHVVRLDSSGMYLDNVKIRDHYTETWEAVNNFQFFVNQTSGARNVRIFYYKMYRNSVLTNHYVPYQNESATRPYSFYDVINNKFATSISFPGVLYGNPHTLLTNDNIESIKTCQTVSVLTEELVYDTMDVTAKEAASYTYVEPDNTENSDDEQAAGHVEVSYSDILRSFPYGYNVFHYTDEDLESKFYIEESRKIGVRKYLYQCISAIGLLDRQYYLGGIFDAEPLASVIDGILGGLDISYTISSRVSSVTIYGWIPYGTKRDALRQVLFSTNVHIFKDENQNFIFDFLDWSTILGIPQSRTFESGSEEYVKKATKVTVTEHSFFIMGDEQEVLLFNNENGASVTRAMVVFDNAPIITSSLRCTSGLTFDADESTTDVAIVTGTGKLYGKPYTHTTRNVEKVNEDERLAEYEVRVTNATLVNDINSESVADRVADYYFNRQISKLDISVQDEQCGRFYTFINAFGEEKTGFLHKMEKTFSSFIRAACEFVCGLSDSGSGNDYTNYVILSTNTSWTPPTGTEKFRLTIIGGGSGGTSGTKGYDGSNHQGGRGGLPGRSGDPGKINIVTLQVSSGDVTVSIGSGGAGGAACSSESSPNSGSAGTETVVTYGGNQYSSASGARSGYGVRNIFTGDFYARAGKDGAGGGAGGNGGQLGTDQQHYDPQIGRGAQGENVTYDGASYAGGAGGDCDSWGNYIDSGGGGGGACGSGAGSNGGNGSCVSVSAYVNNTCGGIGGAGATPLARSAAVNYGDGGAGGHGGGGGGGNGHGLEAQYYYDQTPSTNGSGGTGGAGGNGAAGCVLIYY